MAAGERLPGTPKSEQLAMPAPKLELVCGREAAAAAAVERRRAWGAEG